MTYLLQENFAVNVGLPNQSGYVDWHVLGLLHLTNRIRLIIVELAVGVY